MADPPSYPDANLDTLDDTGVGPDRGATTGISRWQKVVGIIGIVVILWAGNRMFDNFFPSDPGPGPGQGEPPGEIQEQPGPGGPGGHGPGQGEPPGEIQEQPGPGGPGGHGPGQR